MPALLRFTHQISGLAINVEENLSMDFQGDLLRDGVVVKSGVKGWLEETESNGIKDLSGWIDGTVPDRGSFRLRMVRGREVGIIVKAVGVRNGVATTMFKGNPLAT